SRGRHLRAGSARDLAGREPGGLALPAGPPSRHATRRGGARHEHAPRDEPPLSFEAVLFDFGGTLEADGVNWGSRFHGAYVEGGGALDYATFEPIYKESDRALGRLSGIERLGFRATVEAQADLRRDVLPAADGFDARRAAARLCADAMSVVNRNRPVLERLTR